MIVMIRDHIEPFLDPHGPDFAVRIHSSGEINEDFVRSDLAVKSARDSVRSGRHGRCWLIGSSHHSCQAMLLLCNVRVYGIELWAT